MHTPWRTAPLWLALCAGLTHAQDRDPFRILAETTVSDDAGRTHYHRLSVRLEGFTVDATDGLQRPADRRLQLTDVEVRGQDLCWSADELWIAHVDGALRLDSPSARPVDPRSAAAFSGPGALELRIADGAWHLTVKHRDQRFERSGRTLPEYEPVLPEDMVERPIIVLEEEVEIVPGDFSVDPDDLSHEDLENLSNRNLDSTSAEDAYGIGGGAAGAYGQRWSAHGDAGGLANAAWSQSVDAALEWLAQVQSPDGRWDSGGWTDNLETYTDGHPRDLGDPRYDVGVTSLALLAYLGHGQSHRFGDHSRTVRAALNWLKRQQQADGSIGFDQGEEIYNHALATLALCEAYAISRDFTLRRYAQRAVEFCLEAQNPGLGWQYGVRPGRNDTSVTSWMVQALSAARDAGLDVPQDAFDDALAWFDRATDTRGATGYESPGGGSSYLHANEDRPQFPVMTAAALFGRLQCGQRRTDPAIRRGVDLLAESLPRWEDDGTEHANFYYWYEGSHALFQVGGPTWERWWEDVREALLPHQVTDGPLAGSWEPDGEWCLAGGRVYGTALNALTLEASTRFERR